MKETNMLKTYQLVFVLVGLLLLPALSFSAEKLPADRAGTIGNPTGRIAFIRDGNLWIMDANGDNQQLICESVNADGRITWSLDGKKIYYTRSGKLNFQTPDMSGGFRKLYDIFIAVLDSAYHSNTLYWEALTYNMGSRSPEMNVTGKSIIFVQDMNANRVNAFEPNYQLCTMDPNGDHVKILRDDWEGATEFLIAPSMNAKGDIACVVVYKQKQQGMVVLSPEEINLPMDSIKELSKLNSGCVAPSWSPDGKWIAYVNNSMDDGGLYIVTPDLKERFLVFSPPPATNLNTVAPSFSPDSKWITFSTVDGSIWITDLTGAKAHRLTGPGSDKFPAWSH